MNYTIYFKLLFLTCILSTTLGVFSLRQSRKFSSKILGYMLLSVGLWALAAAFEAAAIEPSLKFFWARFEYFGSNLTAVFYVKFTIQYVKYDEWLSLKRKIFIWVIPIINILLPLTNNWHHLVWTGYEPGAPGTNLILYTHGPGYWFIFAVLYIYFAFPTLALLKFSRQAIGWNRRQIRIFLLATLGPWIASVLYSTPWNPVPGLNIIPTSFLITGLMLLWGIISQQFLQIAPLARDRLIETIGDAMIVLNPDLRILDLNPAALTLFGQTERRLRLKSINFLLPNPTIQNALQQMQSVSLEEKITISGADRTFDIRISPIYFTQKEFLGYLLTLRDISTQKELEADREKLINELQEALTEIKTLSGLLPICSACKKIRDDSGYWHNIETYVAKHSYAQFSHGICPDCMRKLYPDYCED